MVKHIWVFHPEFGYSSRYVRRHKALLAGLCELMQGIDGLRAIVGRAALDGSLRHPPAPQRQALNSGGDEAKRLLAGDRKRHIWIRLSLDVLAVKGFRCCYLTRSSHGFFSLSSREFVKRD